MPEREVVDLDSANAHHDSQDFGVGRLEDQRRIQTRPTLLDERKVKPRGVCNRLHASLLRGRRGDRLRLAGRSVVVVQWNGGVVLGRIRYLELPPHIVDLAASRPCWTY